MHTRNKADGVGSALSCILKLTHRVRVCARVCTCMCMCLCVCADLNLPCVAHRRAVLLHGAVWRLHALGSPRANVDRTGTCASACSGVRTVDWSTTWLRYAPFPFGFELNCWERYGRAGGWQRARRLRRRTRRTGWRAQAYYLTRACSPSEKRSAVHASWTLWKATYLKGRRT